MTHAAMKLTALLILSTSAAFAASACGDDGGSETGSGGGGTTTSVSGGDTSSTGVLDDPCAAVPDGCFEPGACFADAPAGVSLRNDLIPLMQRSCTLSSACHTDPTSPTNSEGYKPYLGAKKNEGESDIPTILAAIVDVEAWGDPSRHVVAPGDWEGSYFMNKLDGALDGCPDLDCPDGCGRLMPQGSPKPLPLAERNLFRAWIAEGAQDN